MNKQSFSTNKEDISITKNKISVSHINVRQSISVLILRLILIDIISAAIFTAFHSILFNTSIAQALNISSSFYNSILFLILVIGKISLTIYLVMEWLSEYYEITPEAIVHKKGVIFKSVDKRTMNRVRSIILIRGFVATFLNYGTIRLLDIRLNKYMDLYLVHNPVRYLRILEDLVPNLEEQKEFFRDKNLEDGED